MPEKLFYDGSAERRFSGQDWQEQFENTLFERFFDYLETEKFSGAREVLGLMKEAKLV